MKRVRVAIAVKLVANKLGSMENWIVDLATALSPNFDVTVLTYGPCHESFSEALSSASISWSNLAEIEVSILRSRSFLKNRFDILHASLFAPRDRLVLAARSLPACKLIFQDCFSTPQSLEEATFLSRLADRYTFSRQASLIAVSDFVARRLRARFRRNEAQVRTIYNGVDVQRFQPSPGVEKDCQIICVAALIPAKGVQFLVEAMTSPRLRAAKLTIVGDGPERKRIEQLCESLGISTRVEFAGLRSDVHTLLQRSVVAVHPAVWGEAFGLTITEAMSSGLPIVASSVGAIPEIIEHGLSGILVPAADSLALSSAIGDLLESSDLRDRLSRNARDRVIAEFSLSKWVAEHVREISSQAAKVPQR